MKDKNPMIVQKKTTNNEILFKDDENKVFTCLGLM